MLTMYEQLWTLEAKVHHGLIYRKLQNLFDRLIECLNLPSIEAGTLCSLVMRLDWQWPCVTISTVVTSHEQL